MTKTRFVILLLSGGLFLGLTSLIATRNSEPQYQGQSLSIWLGAYDKAVPNSRKQKEAADAVLHIGTNGLAIMVKWLPYKRPAWKDALLHALRELKPVIGVQDALEQFILGHGEQNARAAEVGFRILGPAASPAAGQLTRMLKDDKDDLIRLEAMVALSEIGKQGLPPLLAVLGDRTLPQLRPSAATQIGCIGGDALPAVPRLVRCLEDEDPYVAAAAARSLGRLQLESWLAVPGLVKALERPLVGRAAAQSLGEFGSEASSAVPSLLKLLTSADAQARREASHALLRIDAEVFKKDFGS